MSQVMGLPAAFHVLLQMASSPSIRMLGRLAASSRSRSVARTRISVPSLKRRAVSRTTAKASGSSSSRTSSMSFTMRSSRRSISLYFSSRCWMSMPGSSSIARRRASTWSRSACTFSAIRRLNSSVRCRSSLLDRRSNLGYSSFTRATRGCTSFRSRCCLSPKTFLKIDAIMGAVLAGACAALRPKLPRGSGQGRQR